MRTMRPALPLVVSILAGSILATTALAQPGGRRPEPPPAPPRDAAPDPDAIKERLARRLEDLDRQQARLREAIARLDRGDAPEDVLRDLEPPRGDGRARRPGPDDGPGERFDGRPDGRPDGRMDGRPEGRGGPDGWDAGQPLTAEGRRWVEEFLAGSMPVMAERVARLREADPQGADRLLMRLAPRLRDAARLKDSDPELFDLRLAEIRVGMDVIDAIRALRHAQEQGQGVDQAAAKVREQLIRQQDIRDRMTTHEIRAMAARLDEMKADAEKRKAGSNARIDEMVRRLLERREPGGRGRSPRPE